MRPVLAFCLSQLPINTAEILMACNNLYLRGQFGYLQTQTKDKLNYWQKADALITYNKCEEISRDLNIYLKECERQP